MKRRVLKKWRRRLDRTARRSAVRALGHARRGRSLWWLANHYYDLYLRASHGHVVACGYPAWYAYAQDWWRP